jgi:hypothetical protein
MDPKELKENFTSQLDKLQAEIIKLREALAQRQELALKLQGAIEAMTLQLSEEERAALEEEQAPIAPTEVIE